MGRRMCGVVAGVAVLLAVPAGAAPVPVPKDAPLPPPTAEQLTASAQNLKEIILAVHNFAGANKLAIPNNSYTKDGKPLLSWRVHLLPYIEEDPLYTQFKLDEPWDGEANKKLIAKMPKLYAPVRVRARDGMTFYRGFAGKCVLFGPEQASLLTAIPDGTSNTGLIFEAAEPVVWTKPDDLPFDAEKKLPKLGGLFDGAFHVGMADGTVLRCRKDADEAELKRLIMPADGVPIDFDKIRTK